MSNMASSQRTDMSNTGLRNCPGRKNLNLQWLKTKVELLFCENVSIEEDFCNRMEWTLNF